MKIMIHTRESRHERPHVHIVKHGKPTEADPKIWLDDLSMVKGSRSKKFSRADLKFVHDVVDRLQDLYMTEWVKIHGQPKPRGPKAGKKISNKKKA